MQRRRQPLGLTLGVVGAVLVAAALCVVWAALASGVRFADQQLAVSLVELHDPVTTISLGRYGIHSPYTDSVHIVHTPQGEWLAFSGRDLEGERCVIPWVPAENAFHEACRGSVFSLQGKLLAGPPVPGMWEFPAHLAGDTLVVNMSTPPQRSEERRTKH